MADEGGKDSLRKKFREHTALGFIAAVAAYLLIGLLIGLALYLFVDPNAIQDSSKAAQAKKDMAQALAFLMAGLAGAIGVYFTWQSLNQTRESTRDTLKLTAQGQITERFTQAVEQLGKEEEVRIGGIYALERIAFEAPDDYHWPVIEILTSYIRKRAKPTSVDKALEELELDDFDEEYQQHQHPMADVQAALYVLARRDHRKDPPIKEDKFIILSHADLRYADLRGANLKGARLRRVKFQGAFLRRVDFEEAVLRRARLDEARLESAIFTRAKLGKACLRKADVEEACFTEADLRSADLTKAKKLRQKQIDEAYGNPETKVNGLKQPAAWGKSLKDQREQREASLKNKSLRDS